MPVQRRYGKLAVVFSPTDARVRPVLRLLPLPLCIALSLAAHAEDEMPVNWDLCPINNAVPPFEGEAAATAAKKRSSPL